MVQFEIHKMIQLLFILIFLTEKNILQKRKKYYLFLKSDNLQYNTLVFWADGTINSLTKGLMFQVFFFIISNRLRALKTLYFHFCNFIKENGKGFCKNFCKILWKKNNMYLEHQTLGQPFICPIIPANQHIILEIDGF